MPTGGGEMEDRRSGAESQAACQMTPLATSGPLSRPGRRPRGFLYFMSNKTSTLQLPPLPLLEGPEQPLRGPRSTPPGQGGNGRRQPPPPPEPCLPPPPETPPLVHQNGH
ncbi:tumor necrosis factor ligand superfamily member 6-like [Oncorhynchus keta]|uniref:tumor necrosis factor ligand superfamily member 6-like n=1 Tax=Oncorhynchus keta TaxID=8018 RepID=UPI00227BED3D|nr:tumor necrosis factor ligand superfamily member 6-like [Oncorhynchus keta]